MLHKPEQEPLKLKELMLNGPPPTEPEYLELDNRPLQGSVMLMLPDNGLSRCVGKPSSEGEELLFSPAGELPWLRDVGLQLPEGPH